MEEQPGELLQVGRQLELSPRPEGLSYPQVSLQQLPEQEQWEKSGKEERSPNSQVSMLAAYYSG